MRRLKCTDYKGYQTNFLCMAKVRLSYTCILNDISEGNITQTRKITLRKYNRRRICDIFTIISNLHECYILFSWKLSSYGKQFA